MKNNLLCYLLLILIFSSRSISLNAQDGSLDKKFGNGGFVLTNVDSQNNGSAYDVLMQPDGKTLVSGKTQVSASVQRAVLMRYKVNGDLDSTFGVNGVTIQSFDDNFDVFSSLALQQDGKIVVSGLSMRNDSFLVLFA